MRIVEDGALIPFSATGPWGLYDADRNIVIEGTDRRGAGRVPHYPDSTWPSGTRPTQTAADANYVYCGRLNPHFGHFLINSLPRFWPFCRPMPAMRVLCAAPASGLPAAALDILSRLGIRAEDIVTFDKPTTIRRVIVPEPSVLEQYWAYTIYRDLCIGIGAGAWQPDEVDSIATPAYLSKSRLQSGVGGYQGEDVIEDVVAAAGIEIVHPQNLDFVDQVRLFATRRLIIGPAGSAFHVAVFAPKGRKLLCYCPAQEVNSNFLLIDKLCENNSHYYHQRGTTYGSSSEFMTIVKPADARLLAEELVALAQRFGP